MRSYYIPIVIVFFSGIFVPFKNSHNWQITHKSNESQLSKNYIAPNDIDELGWLPCGNSTAMEIKGNYAYVGVVSNTYKIIVFDISNLNDPIIVGNSDSLDGEVQDIDFFQNSMIVSIGASGLVILDVNDPTKPNLIGSFDTPGIVSNVYFLNNYAYVADGGAGLRIIDVSDPTNPYETGFLETGYANGIFVIDEIAYVADGWNGLRIIDVSDPANANEIGFLEIEGNPRNLFVEGDIAYLADGENLFYIIDVSDPSAPSIRGGLYRDGFVFSDIYTIDQGIAYVGTQNRGLLFVNVTDPSHPFEIGRYNYGYGNSLSDFSLVGNIGFLALRNHGLQIIDLGSLSGSVINYPNTLFFYGPTSIFVNDDYAYVIDSEYSSYSLRIFDVADPTDPKILGSISIAGYGFDVNVLAGIAYISSGEEGLRIIDVSDPTDPNEIGIFDTPGVACALHVVGEIAYVADGGAGLRIINVSDPTNPFEIGFYDTPGSAVDISFDNGIIYVADYSGMRVIDVTSPINPSEIGKAENEHYYYQHIVVAENTAFVSTQDDKYIYTYDITNPALPIFANVMDLGVRYGARSDIFYSQGILYFANIWGLTLFNTTQQGDLVEISTVGTDCDSAFVINGMAYTIDWWSGSLELLDISKVNSATELGSYFIPRRVDGIKKNSNFMYLDDGMYWHIYNIVDPQKPIKILTKKSPGLYSISLKNIKQNYAFFISDYSEELWITDITNVTDPVEIGMYKTPGNIYDVFVSGNYAYVADGYDGLRIIDISDPKKPKEIGFFDTPGAVHELLVNNEIAYIVGDGLRIIDVSDPTNPFEIGYINTPADNLDLAGDKAFVTSWGKLKIIDVGDPTNPHQIGYHIIPGGTDELYVNGNIVYLADEADGLRVIDASDPSHPVEISYLEYPALDVEFYESLLYLAGGDIFIIPPHLYLTLSLSIDEFARINSNLLSDSETAVLSISEVGDYYLDKLSADKVNTIIEIGINTFKIAGVDWGKVGNGLKKIPGYNASLHASWRGWTDGTAAARHFYKPVYDAVWNDRKILAEQVLWAGLKYFSGEAIQGPVKDWLIRTLTPGSGNPVYDEFGLKAVNLGESYQGQLSDMQNDLQLVLPTLGLTETQEDLYFADLQARQQANALIIRQLQDQRNLLWKIYLDAKADDANWWKLLRPFFYKMTVISGATMFWDGPGFYVASTGLTTYDSIFGSLFNIRNLSEDGKMLDQSLRFLAGRVSNALMQISMNSAGAMRLIQRKGIPQIGEGAVGIINEKSIGNYRLWPKLWWAEEMTLAEIPITNTGAFDTSYTTSAVYSNNSAWTGVDALFTEGNSLDLEQGRQASATIIFMTKDYGISPEEGSLVDLMILGATDTGIYPVASLQTTWNPTRIEDNGLLKAHIPNGFTYEQAESSPTFPYPLVTSIIQIPDSIDQQLSILVTNPFTMPVNATITQAIPAALSVVDSGDAISDGNSLVWTAVISPNLSSEFQALLNWEETPGQSIILPAPELVFLDPTTQQGDTYLGEEETISAVWPVEATGGLPDSWRNNFELQIPITLTNHATTMAVQGTFTMTVRNLEGDFIWSSVRNFNIPSLDDQLMIIPIKFLTLSDYVVVQGEVTIGAVRKELFLELMPVSRYELMLPIIIK